LKATVKDLEFSSYTYTPESTVSFNESVTGLTWVAGVAAIGNVVTNDSPGSEGAVVTMVDGTPIASTGFTTIVGDYGTLSINALGAYTYTPNDTDNAAGVKDEFDYTLSQPDGDTATAKLTVSFTDYNYSSAASINNDFVGGEDAGDSLNGMGGKDVVYGGAGNDNLQGGSDNDNLVGAAGNDTLQGGSGYDILTGGLGADTFVWNLADAPAGSAVKDIVTDFRSGDTLQLNDLLTGSGTSLAVLSGSDTTVQVTNASGVNQTIVLEGFATDSAAAEAIKTALMTSADHKYTAG
jgi:VCBS repeat-containing protein